MPQRDDRAFPLGLVIAAALLVASGAYLAAAREPAALHLAALVLHPLIGLAALLPFAFWAWRRRSRFFLGASLLAASALAGLLLLILGQGESSRPLVWAHVGLGVSGLLAVLWAVEKRGGGFALALVGLAAAIAVPAAIEIRRSDGPGEEIAPFVNPPAPVTVADGAMGGADGPFYPSWASTRSGEVLPAESLSSSESCGRCHPDAVEEWSASAHRFSGLDNPWYRKPREEIRQAVGEDAARWCAGCHAPALLLSGQAGRPAAEIEDSAASNAGVSCTVCHGISKVGSTLGQAHYEIGLPPLHGLATSENRWLRALHDLAVHLDPEPHRRAYTPKPLTEGHASEMCTVCHAAHFDTPVSEVGRIFFFDDYALWQGTTVSGQGVSRSFYYPEPQSCVDCHMPRETENGGGARSHRFASANTALPALRGDAEQLEAVRRSLTSGDLLVDVFAFAEAEERAAAHAEGGEVPPPEFFGDLGQGGVALPPGRAVWVDVVVRNRGVGHGFPGGKLDLHDVWLEFRAADGEGRPIFVSGRAPEGASAPAGSHRYGSIWIDEESQALMRHEVWKIRTRPLNRVIEPGDSEVVRFRVDVPQETGQMSFSARLQHRKFSPELTRWVFEDLEAEAPVLPIVTLAEDTLTLPVGEANAPAADDREPVERWRDYAIGLLIRGDYERSRVAFDRVLELEPDDPAAHVGLAWVARLYRDPEQARRWLEELAEKHPDYARAQHSLSLLERAEGEQERALELAKIAARAYPRDRLNGFLIADLHAERGEWEEALAAYQTLLELEPLNPSAHYGMVRTLEGLGRTEEAAHHDTIFGRFAINPASRGWVQRFLESNPVLAAEGLPHHVHGPGSQDEPGEAEAGR